MSLFWVFYHDNYQTVRLEEQFNREVVIGPEIEHTVTIPSFSFDEGTIRLSPDQPNEGFFVYQGEKKDGKLLPYEAYKIGPLTLMLTDEHPDQNIYYLGNRVEVSFSCGKQEDADIWKEQAHPIFQDANHFSLEQIEGHWYVMPQDETIYVNGKQVHRPEKVEVGDELFWNFLTLSFKDDDLLQVTGHEPFHTRLEKTRQPSTETKQKYPLYRRTPRLIYDLPDERVSFSLPSQESENNSRGLWLVILPPLVMLIVMGIVALVQPRGIFIVVSMAMFIMTLITSSVQYFKEKTQRKRREEKRQRVYTLYLENKRKELQELYDRQRYILTYHYPSFEQMKYLTSEISGRIWEKTLVSDDFLHLRLGTGAVPASYELSMSGGDMANRDIDELMEQTQQMQRVYHEIKDVPITFGLADGPTGLIGKPAIVKNEIHQLVGQLAFSHSYHDLRFVFIFNEQEYKNWEWMKWLPHFQLPHTYGKGFIYNEQTRDQLLSSIYEILRERDLEEEKEKKIFTPHFVFIVTNHELIAEHVILEYLEGSGTDLGISIIFAAETKESLAENISTLVRYINEEEGDILIQHKKAVRIPFTLDAHQRADNELFARTLRTLDHQVGMTNSIPETVSFLDLFHAKQVKDIGIREKWLTSETSKSLSVPIGYKGKNDIVDLNLHEKAHGPHGLLAGTTGSGKSEFLQTYILSLAVHFHPHEVAFLLIDYKGGGMAQPFRNIPHLLGTITNIEGSKNFSERALASIKSELRKRQRLFDQYHVNHINDYTKLYKEKKAEQAMPHLFLISDEFAELKSEEPDFIRELVSAARIGRSLGVHLILATQKPGGVIDDQIWSNSRFKVALKVQDASDSKEILKNSDAASITVTGRGYLQVGNNEIYELFQSAWSGAPYMEDGYGSEDDIAIVTDTGLVPLSGVSTEPAVKKETVTEISVVVDEIERMQHELGIEKLPSPWLPPLEERIPKTRYVSSEEHVFHFALVDEPDQQSQHPLSYQMMEDGNIGIFGSSGYGKSLAATTLLMSFAERYSPEEWHVYIYDFGNGSLLPLAKLPHTADYFLMDQMRKIQKSMKRLREEVEYRKRLLRQQEISHIKMYNALNKKKLPFIFIVIDNFDIVKDEMHDLEAEFIQLSRDGQSLGIYFIITATRVNAVRQSLMNNLKTKIVHYLMDQGEAYSMIGRPKFSLEPIPGRVIINKEELYFAQMFLPVEAENDLELFEHLKQEIQLLHDRFAEAEKPKPVPMLPDKLTAWELESRLDQQRQPYQIPVGLDEESVAPVYFDLKKNKHCLIIGQTQRGKTNVAKLMLDHLLEAKPEKLAVFDSIDRGLSHYAKEENIDYLETKDDITEWAMEIDRLFKAREAMYVEAVRNGETDQLAFPQVVLVVDGITRFQQTIDTRLQDQIADFMKSYAHLGFSLVASGNHTEFSKGYDALTNEVKQVRHALLLMKKSEQSIIPLPYVRQEPEIQPGFGYMVENGKEKKIQVPLCAVERKSVQ